MLVLEMARSSLAVELHSLAQEKNKLQKILLVEHKRMLEKDCTVKPSLNTFLN